jgi:hypothetical protein
VSVRPQRGLLGVYTFKGSVPLVGRIVACFQPLHSVAETVKLERKLRRTLVADVVLKANR